MKGNEMLAETREMRVACCKARAIINGYTLNRNFLYCSREAARQGLEDTKDRALQTLEAAKPKGYKMTTCARLDYSETRAYIIGKYAKLLDFIESWDF